MNILVNLTQYDQNIQETFRGNKSVSHISFAPIVPIFVSNNPFSTGTLPLYNSCLSIFTTDSFLISFALNNPNFKFVIFKLVTALKYIHKK